MCRCGRSRSQSSNSQSVSYSEEPIFIPVENVQSAHSAITHPLGDHVSMPLTNISYYINRATSQNLCLSLLQSSNIYFIVRYESSPLVAPLKEGGTNYKMSLQCDWDCVSHEVGLICTYKHENENARPSDLRRRKIESTYSVLDKLEENEKNYTAKKELTKMNSEFWDDEHMDIRASYNV